MAHTRIKSFKIRNSEFFGEGIDLDFSTKMNCIMGGRGTGKTTLLTILNWTISPDDSPTREALPLIKSNLKSGSAEVVFEDDQGNEFTVIRMFGDAPTVKDAQGEHVPFESFTKQFGIDFFPTGAIEGIGVEPRQRLRLFDGYIGGQIAEINAEIGMVVSRLQQNEIQIKSTRRELAQLQEERQGFGDVEAELKKAKEELSASEADAGLKDKFETENKKQAKRTLEKNYLAKAREAIAQLTQKIDSLESAISSSISLAKSGGELDSPGLKSFASTAQKDLDTAQAHIDELKKITSSLGERLVQASASTHEEHERAEGEFSKLRQTIEKNRDLFQRLNKLSQRATAMKLSTEQIKVLSDKLKALTDGRGAIFSELRENISSRTELRRNKAAEVNDLLGQKVKILIKEGALNGEFEEILRKYLATLSKRITGAERQILDASNPQELATAIEKGEADKIIKQCGILDKDRVKDWFIALRNTDLIFELQACVCEDAPNFFLGVESVEGDKKVESFKPTEELSTGQRCTAVLPIIFSMTKRPLLVDQPEDNLDNKYITQAIHEILRKIKEDRQLIFVTHNPNIPVISDSEHNVFLSYYGGSAHVDAAGDVGTVKSYIVELLEGGEKAFLNRKKIYGY